MNALFAHPQWLPGVLWLLVATLAALLGGLVALRRRARRLGVPPAPLLRRHAARDGCLLIALAAIGLARAGPLLGERIVRDELNRLDVVLLIDLSKSMDARDVAPSRLHRARRAAHALIGSLDADDRIALAGFSGRGVLFTPLTPDHDAVAALLPDLRAGSISPGGSDPDAALGAATRVFDESHESGRAIVLISDGERTRGEGEAGARAAAARGARVIALGLGSEAGAEIPTRGGPLRDERDRIVHSRFREGPLRRLTEATGGLLLRADRFGVVGRDRLDAALERIRVPGIAGDHDAGAAHRQARGTIWVTPLVWIAAVALLIELLPIASPRREDRRAQPALALALALIAAAALGAQPGSGDLEGAPEARLRHAAQKARAGDLEGAARGYRQLLEGAPTARVDALAHHGLGVLAFARGDLRTAAQAFEAALGADAGLHAAAANLAYVVALRRSESSEDRSTPPEPMEDDAEARRARESREASPQPPHAVPPLTDAQRRRWLDRVDDDGARTLRAALESGGLQRADRRPTW